MGGENLAFGELSGAGFVDRNEKPVKVMKVSGGPRDVAAFMYQCVLNRDVDGAGNTYGWNNPQGLNTANDRTLQINLDPKDGLGNACGDPGDGTKGWKNFGAGGHNFYWSSVVAKKRREASATIVLDTRPRVEAGRGAPIDPKAKTIPPLLAEGEGYFPVIQLSGPTKGYYISTTATYTERGLSDTNTAKWVDGLKVPYTVWAGEWLNWKIAGKHIFLGDCGLAINNMTGKSCGFFFGDAGTPNKVGESSGKLFEALGNTDAQPISFIVFPGSGNGKEVGPDPQNVVGLKVLWQMLKLCTAKNALELPMRLAFPGLTVPKKQAEMTDLQASTYKTILGALRGWGIWPGK